MAFVCGPEAGRPGDLVVILEHTKVGVMSSNLRMEIFISRHTSCRERYTAWVSTSRRESTR